MLRIVLVLLVSAVGADAQAQIYRWVDANGTVHYSNATPPPGVKATTVDIDARPGPASVESSECYTVRCQGVHRGEHQSARKKLEPRRATERAAAAPKRPKGLDFRNYVSIQRGMTEGELLVIAGEPDLLSDQGAAIAAPSAVQAGRNLRVPARTVMSLKTYPYLPTVADPFTTTITLVGGRVSEIERVRKF